MYLEIFLGVITLILIYDYISKKHRNDLIDKSGIKGPTPLPIIGNALYFRNVTHENNMEFMRETKKKYGKMQRFWLLHNLHVSLSDAKYIEYLLSSQQLIKKNHMYGFLESWLGTGLLLSTGKKWHTRRKIITPTFHFKILEQFVEVFDQQSTIMIKQLQEKADGKTPINIFPVICLMALDIITETAMGVKVHAQENRDVPYVKALSRVAYIMGDRFIQPLLQESWLFALLKPRDYFEVTKSINIMHDFTDKVIKERSELLQKSIADGTFKKDEINQVDDVGKKKRMAFLDVLLQSSVNGQPLSNEDIREEVDTFMFEGHDTTTSGISFCLYLIARHADAQKKLVEEIHAVIGTDKTAPVTYQNLQDLKYLDLVIKESLRLYPPVPAIGRETTEDVVLGDITIPAKTAFDIHFHMTLRDPDYFDNPDDFIPERFNADNEQKFNPFIYTPFSAGPRNCIGQKFAILEMKSTISKILRNFELLPMGPDVHLVMDLVLRSSTGVHIGLKPRK